MENYTGLINTLRIFLAVFFGFHLSTENAWKSNASGKDRKSSWDCKSIPDAILSPAQLLDGFCPHLTLKFRSGDREAKGKRLADSITF